MNELAFSAVKGIEGEITPPPSKSYTHRAIVIASIAHGRSQIHNPLLSRDTVATIEACRAFGAEININPKHSMLSIIGTRPKVPDNVVNVENSGTTLRFMTSLMTGSSKGFTVLTGDASVRKRPMQPLLNSLSMLGGKAYSARFDGHAPIIIKGNSLEGGEAKINGSISSQFVSSLLISSTLSKRGLKLYVSGAVSRPYIDATITVMKIFGLNIFRDSFRFFEVKKGEEYEAREFFVPSDLSSIAFLVAAVALKGGRLKLNCKGLQLPQADLKILEFLKKMGVKLARSDSVLTVEHDGGRLEGGEFKLSDCPDLLPVISVLGLNCKGGVKINGVEHARFKETDRISAIREELVKAGVVVGENRDGITVKPGKLLSTVLDSRGDHRLFMAFSLVSLLSDGKVRVRGEETVDVSYPNYIRDLQAIGVKVEKNPK